MIELIFALVIMGITMLSAPLLISQATNSSFTAFQQESVAMLASHTNAMLTYAWDEQNTESQVNFTLNILTVTDGNPALDGASRVNPGSRQDTLRAATTLMGLDGNFTTPDTVDDVDDFSGLDQNLSATIDAIISDGEYIDQDINITTQVNYIVEKNVDYTNTSIVYDLPKPTSVASTNIKHITTTLTSISTSNELNSKNIVLRAFMCNIGAAKILSSQDVSTLSNATAAGLY